MEESKTVSKPYYWHEKKINFNRRATWHDYSSVCIYMITLRKANGIPPFAILSGSPSTAYTRSTPVGDQISFALSELHKKFPECRVDRHVLMPDHIHFILSVNERLQGFTLSKLVNSLMGNSTARLRKEGLIAAEASAFAKGFNDRILSKQGQLQIWKNYISDNPRRLVIIKERSSYFKRISAVTINGRRCTVYGNFLLLRKPEKALGVISSRYSAEERRHYNALWSESLRCGGVLVSPFISEKEKALYAKAVAAGLSIIRIVKGGLPERFKPWKSEFDLCGSGRLLLIADDSYDPQGKGILRNECLELNDFARYIVSAEEPQLTLLAR
ncbi:MAG: transposase [Muribaculaceae bacterium]|nr:transposase [Muribaculaceae bacterium]